MAFLARVTVAVVFVSAAVPKIGDPGRFAEAISTYRLLPESGAVLLALWLQWLELCAGCAILISPMRRAALAILLTLTVAFGLALLQAWCRGLDITCGCFGNTDAVHGAAYAGLLLRDGLLLGLLCWLWRASRAAIMSCPLPR